RPAPPPRRRTESRACRQPAAFPSANSSLPEESACRDPRPESLLYEREWLSWVLHVQFFAPNQTTDVRGVAYEDEDCEHGDDDVFPGFVAGNRDGDREQHDAEDRSERRLVQDARNDEPEHADDERDPRVEHDER